MAAKVVGAQKSGWHADSVTWHGHAGHAGHAGAISAQCSHGDALMSGMSSVLWSPRRSGKPVSFENPL